MAVSDASLDGIGTWNAPSGQVRLLRRGKGRDDEGGSERRKKEGATAIEMRAAFIFKADLDPQQNKGIVIQLDPLIIIVEALLTNYLDPSRVVLQRCGHRRSSSQQTGPSQRWGDRLDQDDELIVCKAGKTQPTYEHLKTYFTQEAGWLVGWWRDTGSFRGNHEFSLTEWRVL